MHEITLLHVCKVYLHLCPGMLPDPVLTGGGGICVLSSWSQVSRKEDAGKVGPGWTDCSCCLIIEAFALPPR